MRLVVDCSSGEAVEAEDVFEGVRPPDTVTPRQARLVLAAHGVLDAVEAAIAGMDEAARIEWEYALEIRRDSPLVASLAALLAFDDAATDAMFIEAAAM